MMTRTVSFNVTADIAAGPTPAEAADVIRELLKTRKPFLTPIIVSVKGSDKHQDRLAPKFKKGAPAAAAV